MGKFNLVASVIFASLLLSTISKADVQQVAVVWNKSKNTITLLPPVSGYPDAQGYSINDKGDMVVGTSYDHQDVLPPVATIWKKGIASALPIPPGFTRSNARAINNRGEIVGAIDNQPNTPNVRHVALWKNGVVTDLLTPPDCIAAEAIGINDKGHIIVRGRRSSGIFRGYIYVNGSYTDLGTLNAAGNVSPSSINNNDEVVGSAEVLPGSRAFIWKKGQMSVVSNAIDCPSGSTANGNNNKGDIVGQCFKASGPSHGALWDKKMRYYDMGVFNGLWTAVSAINNSSKFIGAADADPGSIPLIWNGKYDMQPLAIPDGFNSVVPFAINKSGIVVGTAINRNVH